MMSVYLAAAEPDGRAFMLDHVVWCSFCHKSGFSYDRHTTDGFWQVIAVIQSSALLCIFEFLCACWSLQCSVWEFIHCVFCKYGSNTVCFFFACLIQIGLLLDKLDDMKQQSWNIMEFKCSCLFMYKVIHSHSFCKDYFFLCAAELKHMHEVNMVRLKIHSFTPKFDSIHFHY